MVSNVLDFHPGEMEQIGSDNLTNIFSNGTKPPITLSKTNIAPENGWLEYNRFLLGRPIFRGELLVSGSVYRSV